VLEAFTYAGKLTADYYKQKNRLATEHALIDDNGDGTGHEEATAGDGTLAKTMYLDSKPLAQAGSDAELARLLNERQRLEEAVEKLKARKAELKPEDYDRQLEDLLVELAKVNQTIKAKPKQ
jgi:chorismate mutase